MEPTLAQKTIEIAYSQIGVREQPAKSNDGPQVSTYLRWVGLKPGYAWCAAFGSWCIHQADIELGGPRQPIKFKKSAGAHNLYQINTELHITKPEPNCVVVWDHGKGKGHVGLVVSIGEQCFLTIEGNTDAGGSREGDGVYLRNDRHINDPKILGFLKIQ